MRNDLLRRKALEIIASKMRNPRGCYLCKEDIAYLLERSGNLRVKKVPHAYFMNFGFLVAAVFDCSSPEGELIFKRMRSDAETTYPVGDEYKLSLFEEKPEGLIRHLLYRIEAK